MIFLKSKINGKHLTHPFATFFVPADDPAHQALSAVYQNREYFLFDNKKHLVGSAFPGYADGNDPDVVGWPICRMQKVDHANVSIDEKKYILTMHNSQNYFLVDTNDSEALHIMHKGISGGWMVESNCGFTPEIICGIFTFCRYIEEENEFLIV